MLTCAGLLCRLAHRAYGWQELVSALLGLVVAPDGLLHTLPSLCAGAAQAIPTDSLHFGHSATAAACDAAVHRPASHSSLRRCARCQGPPHAQRSLLPQPTARVAACTRLPRGREVGNGSGRERGQHSVRPIAVGKLE